MLLPEGSLNPSNIGTFAALWKLTLSSMGRVPMSAPDLVRCPLLLEYQQRRAAVLGRFPPLAERPFWLDNGLTLRGRFGASLRCS